MTPARPGPPRAVRIEVDNERAWCGERRLDLTPRSFAVLRYLVEHAQQLITKDDLLATVWRDAIVSDAALASCIRDLRRALGDAAATPRYIRTVHRRGFRFIGPVAPSPAQGSAPGPSAGADVVGARASRSPGSSPAALTLVGRDAELAWLHTRFRRALGGHRQLVFVTGEPGIGKTALVEAFLAELAERHALRIGRGQCVEQYGSGEGYLPVLDALGRLGRAAGGEQLVQILRQHAPTWLAQLPALLSDPDVDAVQRRAQGSTRDRMLRELVEALDMVTRDAPLVLLLEDLHWSDSATIDLLAMLARRRDQARLLVVGTYRPADVAVGAHPLNAVKQELRVHGYCEDLPLEFLSVSSVEQYLSRRFPGHAFPGEVARVLHRSTDGNALFLVNAVDYLISRGQISEVDGEWRLSRPVNEIVMGTPQTLSQMVEKQVERLTEDEQAMLEVASAAGPEFSAAVAVAGRIDLQDGERRCEALARRGEFLRAVGIAEWPDGTVAGRYAFVHVLYQQVLYGRMSAGHRVGLHLRIGQCLERAYGQRAGDIAGELAMHFEHGRDFERACAYRRRAGEHTLRQHAYREAADHATRALGSLGTLPGSPQRVQQELALQVLLGAALTATHGYAAADVARAYARARELCAEVGDRGQLFPVLLGLGRFYLVRGEFETARDVATHLLRMAEETRDVAVLLAAHNAVGTVSFYAGDFAAALRHLEQGMALYDPKVHSPTRSPAFGLGQDPGVSCTIHAAWALWMLGYPARAAARAQEGLALARSLEHPFSMSYACHFAAGLYQWRGDRDTVRELERQALALDAEHGFGLFLTAGMIQRGWLLCEDGHAEEGLAQMREGISRHQAIGAAVLVPGFLGLVAEQQEKSARPAEGLAAVTEALASVQRSGRHYWEAELHRLRGALTLRTGGTSGGEAAGPGALAGEAESCFREAIDVARKQSARSLELRAATSLSRLWLATERRREAHALLAPIHHSFTEGADTADLEAARALLARLGT